MIKDKKFLVTGGSGFFGSWVVEKLIESKVKKENIFVPRIEDYDLRKREDIETIFKKFKADIVIHLATVPGGMAYYKEHPGRTFFDNLMMGAQLLEVSKNKKIEKMVIAGTTLAYPENAAIPYVEKDIWKGCPNEIEAPYGLSNRMLLAQAEAYRKEYGLNCIYLIFTSLYGPRDHFDSISHVIPSMIKKFDKAKIKKEKTLSFWGSGNAKREFIYVEDAASAIIDAIEKYNSKEPLNIGSGIEVSIKDLAKRVSDIIGYKGKILWDTTKPGGRPRRMVDSSKAKKEIGLKIRVNLDAGLNKTIEWYLKNKTKINRD